MSTISQDKLSKTRQGWDLAVRDAEIEVEKARVSLGELEAALAVCKRRRDAGEPFPGERLKQGESGNAAIGATALC